MSVPRIGASGCGFWPTPHGMCCPNKRQAGPSGNELGRAVNLWPTPTTEKGLYNRKGASEKSGDGLATAVRRQDGGTPTRPMTLNPAWVEWLMGWPIGWTDLEPLVMAKFRLWLRLHGKC